MDTLQWASVKEDGLNHDYYFFRVFRAFRGLNDFYYSCPFVSISGSFPSMDARRNCRAGALERAIHALPSPFSSLLPTLEAHCKVSTHYFLLSSPSSLLSCPFVSISGSIIIPFVLFVLFVVPSSLTEAHCKVSTHYLLPSPPFSLLYPFQEFLDFLRHTVCGADEDRVVCQ